MMGNSIPGHEDILPRLRDGNAGFAKERMACGGKETGMADGEINPFAVVVSCSDMDATPEAVFGCKTGDLYVVRVAGNLVDDIVLGSVVLAVRRYACPVIVVLGHDRCETIHTAMSPDEALIREPAPVIKMMERLREDIASRNGSHIEYSTAARSNIRAGVERIVDDTFIADRMADGLLCVVPALFHHETGEVEWL